MRGIGLFNSQQSEGYNGRNSINTAKNSGLEYILRGGGLQPRDLYGARYNVSGLAWVDKLYLGSPAASSISPILEISNPFYYIATLGLGVGTHKGTVKGADTVDSTVLTMAKSGTIPSASWGYTAGASYDELRIASLVLGGYDQARTKGQSATFALSAGGLASSELKVSVASFQISYRNSSGQAAVPSLFDAIIDSTLPYLFLPTATCDWLATLLHLEYDRYTNLYTIDRDTLASNRDNIHLFSMTIGPTSSANTSSTVTIDFPYDAFNVNATWYWNYNGTQAIFPIQRAPSETAVLGRPFFQEAYVSLNDTSQSFSVWQAAERKDLPADGSARIVNIYNATTQAQLDSHSTGLSTGAIAGIAVGGAIAALAILVLALFCCWWKPRQKKKRHEKELEEQAKSKALQDRKDPLDSPSPASPDSYLPRNTFESLSSNLTEMDASMVSRRPTMRHSRTVSELSSGSDETYTDAGRTRSGNILSAMGPIHELQMADKSDAAEYERMEVERRAREAAAAAEPQELEGSGHFLQTPPAH
ncbi:hypothetical protein FKW77_002389 [Venturia effusa]|uniref:Peptidase A1 domain-containing protein n=1 Tax=Venturia effusa TaxID=50376 RepID=A0A517LPQ9_9PEZI|nr:hypothetical protein FKW77_002389 [Venturia effusa]